MYRIEHDVRLIAERKYILIFTGSHLRPRGYGRLSAVSPVVQISDHTSEHAVIRGHYPVVAVYVQLSQRTDVDLEFFFFGYVGSQSFVERVDSLYDYRLTALY